LAFLILLRRSFYPINFAKLNGINGIEKVVMQLGDAILVCGTQTQSKALQWLQKAIYIRVKEGTHL